MVIEEKIDDAWHCVWDGRIRPRVTGRESDGRWPFDYPMALDRNYSFFADLAGVRGPGPSPRGVPDGVSAVTQLRLEEWGSDAHSHSWCTLEDFCSIWATPSDEAGVKRAAIAALEDRHPDWTYVLFGVDSYAKTRRVIYWFDN